MKQYDFEKQHSAFWAQFEILLKNLEKSSKKYRDDVEWALFPKQYRKLCQHYSSAQSRQYSPILTDHLHQLVLRAHRILYRQKSSLLKSFIKFIAQDFPQSLRKNWKSWSIASALFYIPALFMGIACFIDSEFIYSLLSYDKVQSIEYMYEPDNAIIGREEGRESDSDFMMFGFYIYNNISIDFRTFASGLLLGIGSIFFILLNGLILGAISGHLTNIGSSETFWPFVSAHSAPELTALTIAGAAGLKLGYALINPKKYSRIIALKQAGIESFPLICGAVLLTFIAAFIEGFWSATGGIPIEVKYAVGIFIWAALFCYLLLAGRSK